MRSAINKSLIATAVASVSAISAPAFADVNSDGHWTFSIGVGQQGYEDQAIKISTVASKFRFEPGTSYSAAVGYDWGKYRGEISYEKKFLDVQDYSVNSAPSTWYALNGPITLSTVSLKGYRDFRNGKRIQPYLGAGIGQTEANLDYIQTHGSATQTAGGSDTETSYELIAGLTYEATEKVDLYSEYKLTSTGNFDLGTSYKDLASLDGNSVNAGVRFKF